MKLNKVLQGTLVVAAAAATWMGVGVVDASAAGASTVTAGGATLQMDPANQALEVSNATSAKEILFAVGTPNKKGEMKVTAWDVYDYTSGAVSIDLSKLSNTKDNYILVKTDVADTPAIIKIPAVAKASKAVFDAAAGEVAFGTGKNASEANTAAKNKTGFEYRTAFSSWKEVKDANTTPDWSKFQQQGAVLYFRTPAFAKSDTTNNLITESTATIKLNGDTEGTKVYEATSLPGKEAKLTIPKRANGPAVAVDYVKGTVKLPRKSEYRVVKSNTTMNTLENTDNPDAKTLAADTFFDKTADASVNSAAVEVRIAADTSKKKAASKWTRVVVDKPVDLGNIVTPGEAIETMPPTPSPTTYNWGDKGIKDAKVVKVTNGPSVITAEYKQTGSGKNAKYSSIVLKNTDTEYSYQVIVTDKKETPAQDAAGAKLLKKNSASGLVLKNVKDGSYIYIRKAGDKAGKTWVGLYQLLGVVDYPKSVTVTPAPTTAQ